MWIPREQSQPGSFSRERKEPGNEVVLDRLSESEKWNLGSS